MIKVKLNLRDGEPHYTVKMCGDYNDADYSYSEEDFSESEFDEVKELLYDMQNLDEDYDDITSVLQELFDKHGVEIDYPYGDASGDGIHTLCSIDITFIDNNGYIYDVELEQQ